MAFIGGLSIELKALTQVSQIRHGHDDQASIQEGNE